MIVGATAKECECVSEREQQSSMLSENQEWVCWLVSTHSQWPVACNWAPAVSLSVFLLITHHSSRGKAPHKLQHIVSRRSACHHAAPCFRTRLIVHGEESWGSSEGLSVTHIHTQQTPVCPHSHTCTRRPGPLALVPADSVTQTLFCHVRGLNDSAMVVIPPHSHTH